MTNPQQQPVSEEQAVFDFLKSNPAWLATQPDLLKELALHDQSNGTISLADRQLQQLRDENKTLKRDLNDFLSNARENENLLHNTFELCLDLLCSNDINDLYHQLSKQALERFGVSNIKLCLYDSKYGDDLYCALEEVKDSLGDHYPTNQIITGRLRENGRNYLFGNDNQVSSVALIPLMGDKQEGVLAFGSTDEHHFAPEKGDLFLQLFAKTMTLWLTQKA